MDSRSVLVTGAGSGLGREAQKCRASAAAGAAGGDSAKINDIYATMSADDIVRISAKLPDPDVVAVLTSLDEKKSGKILAVLPADRAAKITERMSHVTVASAAPAPLPRASL